jgi:DNA-binding MarR family transcriptional regulator
MLLLFLQDPDQWWTASAMTTALGWSRVRIRGIHDRLVEAHWAVRVIHGNPRGITRHWIRLTPAAVDRARVVLRDSLIRADASDAAALNLSMAVLYAPGSAGDSTEQSGPAVTRRPGGRITPHARLVLLLLLQDVHRTWHGNAMARRLGLGEETVRYALKKLEKAGWVTRDKREDPDGQFERYDIALTAEGAEHAPHALEEGLTALDITFAEALGLSTRMLESPADGAKPMAEG